MQWSLNLGHFTLKIAELCCTLPLCSYLLPCTCGIDKNYPKLQEIQLAVHYGDGRLIAIHSYRFVANWKSAALSLLKILHYDLCISQYLSLYIIGRFSKASHKYVLSSVTIITMCAYACELCAWLLHMCCMHGI